jgi:DNA mismatch repair protein MutL
VGRIRILEDHLVNQIAAGEVVERPSSVVKELVENALDAGATRVEVELRAGGRELIRIQDNGSGMDPDDVLMCIERHGTSKIRGEEDLGRVHTLGFRGEALPSIASVARVEIISRPASAEAGFRVVVEGGRMRKPEPTGAPVGTRLTVRNLFFNIPVRRGFLRTVPTELGHCVEAVLREAMVRPSVGFKVEHEGRTVLSAPVVETRAERARDLLKTHGDQLFEVRFSSGTLQVEGLLSPVGVHKASASGAMHLYVNGRYVRDLTLRRAINQAYRNLVPRGRYPVVVLEVRLPVEDVDVNIHPAKTEVRFRFGQDLFEAVSEGVRSALDKRGLQSTKPFVKRAPLAGQEALGFTRPETVGLAGRTGPSPQDQPEMILGVPSGEPAEPAEPTEPKVASLERNAPQQAVAEPGAAWGITQVEAGSTPRPRPVPPSGLRALCTLSCGRFLCEDGTDLLIFSLASVQSALMVDKLQSGALTARPLLTPLLIDLPQAAAKGLLARLSDLPSYLRIEDYGEGSFAVMALPPAAARGDLQSMVRGLADGGEVNALLVQTALAGTPKTFSPFELKALTKELRKLDYQSLALRIEGGELDRRVP